MKPPRRNLFGLFLPLLGCALLPGAQLPPSSPPREEEDRKLPNGKSQKDEILKADHEKNLQDAGKLIQLSEDLKEALEKNTQYVFSLEDLKRLDEIEKLAKRLRSRIRRY